MPSIVIRDASGKIKLLSNDNFDYEDVLQKQIADMPLLIPMEAITEETVVNITIGHEWPAGNGSADVVLLGSDAVITIVETKLKKSPEARREVIAQVIEYAAYLSEWTISEISRQAEESFNSDKASAEFQNKTFNQVIREFREDSDEGVDAFKASVERNLRQGRIRLVVAVDEVGEQAQKIISFVNSYSAFDIYLLQISAYEQDGQQIFVPSLFGYARKVGTTRQRIVWNWEKYESDLGWSEDVIRRAKALISRLETIAQGWGAETAFYENWVDVACAENYEVFGVQNFKRYGLNLYFWLDRDPGIALPQGVYPRQTKEYRYLSGDLEGLPDEQLRGLCEAALRHDGANPAA